MYIRIAIGLLCICCLIWVAASMMRHVPLASYHMQGAAVEFPRSITDPSKKLPGIGIHQE